MRTGVLTILEIVIFSLAVNAQPKKISGKVVSDEDGKPVTGVSVTAKGTNTGTISDRDGFYELFVPDNTDFLVFSFVGMKTLELPADLPVINATLEADVIGLDEVVVIAYGTSIKQRYPGSLSTIGSAELDRFNTTGITEALQGMISGIYTTSASGQPGVGDEIRVRGFSTFGDASPLFVLDGFPYDGNLNSIPVSEIESVTVLKDAPATALYGSRAANGVIILTTKKGIPGASGLNLSMSYGISGRAIPDYEKVSVSDYYELQWEGIKNSLINNGFSESNAAAGASEQLVSWLGGYNAYNVPDGELAGPAGKINPEARLLWHDNWQEELYTLGKRSELSLSSGGGNERSVYYLSGSVLDESGVIKASNLKRYAVRANLNSKLTPYLTAGINLSGALSEQNHPESSGNSLLNPFRFTGFIAPIYPVYLYDENGMLQKDGQGSNLFDFGTEFGRARPYAPNLNPLGTIELDERLYKTDVFTLRSYLEFILAKGLTFKPSLSADYNAFSGLTHKNMLYGDGRNFNGRTTRESSRIFSYSANQALQYNRQTGEHEMQFLAAHENYSYKYNTLNATRSGFPFPRLVELDGAAIPELSGSYEDNYRLESYFGNIYYAFKNRYFASVNYRTDGNSRFTSNIRWGNFWGAGLAWLLSEEEFLKNNEWLDVLKIKVSYGEQGNDRIGSYYGYQGLYQMGINNIEYPGIIASRLSTPGLSWESLNSFNTGINLVFNERYSFNIEYYNRQNNDLLFEKPLPPSTGFTFVDSNIARLANTGFDVEFSGLLYNGNNLRWHLNINLGHFKNEIKELPQEFIINGDKRWEKGRSVYDFWMEEFAGVNPETGKAQWYYDIPETDNPDSGKERGVTETHSQAGRYYVGSAVPDLFGGITNSFSFYGFDLSVLVTFRTGGVIYDYSYQRLMHSGLPGDNFHADMLNRWTSENPNSNIPVVDGDQFANARSSQFLTGADYLNIRNAVLGYEIPGKLLSGMKIKSMKFNVKAGNLLLLASRKGLNPIQSFEGNVQPDYIPRRTVTAGLDIHF